MLRLGGSGSSSNQIAASGSLLLRTARGLDVSSPGTYGAGVRAVSLGYLTGRVRMEKWKLCVVPVILRERLTLPGPVSRKVTGFAPPPTGVKERTALFGLNGARSFRDLAPVKQGRRGSRRKGAGGGGAGACVKKSCGRLAAGRGRHTDNNTTPRPFPGGGDWQESVPRKSLASAWDPKEGPRSGKRRFNDAHQVFSFH